MNEDVIVLALVLAVLSIPVAIIFLMVKVSSLTRRVRGLEADLEAMASARASAPEARPAPPPEEPVEAASPPAKSPWPAKAATGQDPVRTPTPPPPRPATPPPPQLMEPGFAARATDWLAANWFYVVAAASLALAGIFLIQYGVERGLLPPPLRVAAAVAFGAGLIVAGEWLRRRWGDGEDVATAYLPSVFSGAGVVTLFAAVLGARHLYDLIGPGMSLLALIAVALGAIVLGWFYGPLLVAVGLVGGALAPFVVGGGGDDVAFLHGYFALLGLIGLSVDAVRRWPLRWVSALAVAAGMGGSSLLWLGAGDDLAYLLALVALTAGAIALPVRRIWPDHDGKMITEIFAGRGDAPIQPEVILAAATVTAASAMASLVGYDGTAAFWPAAIVLMLLIAGIALWADRARGLQDVALVPLAAVFGLTAQPLLDGGADITWALVAGGAVSVMAFLRTLRGAPSTTDPIGWPLAAVLVAPAMGLLLHIQHDAPGELGSSVWAFHAMAVAALVTGFAGVWARRDGDDRLRTSLAVLLAFTVMGYAIGQVAGEAALTLSIAGMAALAGWLDKQFRLPLLTWFIVLAAPFTGWRLLAEPGWIWALEGPLLFVILSFGGALAGFVLAWWFTRARDRLQAEVTAETASLSIAGLSLILLIWRGMNALDLDAANMAAGLTATIWLLLSWVQLERLRRTDRLRRVRRVLAWVFGALGAICLALAVTVANPLLDVLGAGRVSGPIILNTLIPAYLIPAGMLMLFRHRLLRWAGVALAVLWAVLTIRHFWNGADWMEIGFGASQAEITSYTALMLIVGGAAFYQGIASRYDLWRKAGLVVLGLTAAKVFLIDAASLSGLLRVGAFVALAFSLAGLAWLNRWAGGAEASDPPGGPSEGPPTDAATHADPVTPHDHDSDSSEPDGPTRDVEPGGSPKPRDDSDGSESSGPRH